MHLKIHAFKPGFENCQNLNQVVVSQFFTSLWNRCHQWFSDIELIHTSVFSASYPRINPRFTAGKRIGVLDFHATRGHWKTTIFTSIVFCDPSILECCHEGKNANPLPFNAEAYSRPGFRNQIYPRHPSRHFESFASPRRCCCREAAECAACVHDDDGRFVRRRDGTLWRVSKERSSLISPRFFLSIFSFLSTSFWQSTSRRFFSLLTRCFEKKEDINISIFLFIKRWLILSTMNQQTFLSQTLHVTKNKRSNDIK